MADYIMLPRSLLTDEIRRDPNLSRLLLYLLGKANDTGEVTIDTAELCREYGWSRQQSRTLISKLKSNVGVTATSTAKATTLIFDIQRKKPKRQPQNQPHEQPHNEANLPTAQDGFERFRDYFNSSVSGTSIPQLKKWTEPRKKALRSIFKEYDKATVETVIKKAIASDFLSGRKTDYRTNFDWIFKKANFLRILEGTYDNRTEPDHTKTQYDPRRGTDVGNHTADDYGGPF